MRKATFFILLLFAVAIYEVPLVFSEPDDAIVLEKGKHRFCVDYSVPKGKILLIKPGAHLIMGEGVQLKVYGKVIAIGTSQEPIVLEGDGAYWRGIDILGENPAPDIEEYKNFIKSEGFEKSAFSPALLKGNLFIFCEFRNLATDKKKNVLNRIKAVIEAQNTSLLVAHSRFSDVIQMGCIQAHRSLMLVSHNLFDSKMMVKIIHGKETVLIAHHNILCPKRYEVQTWPDAMYMNNGLGIFAYNEFNGIADDGISFDGSWGFLFNNKFKNIYDDAIDIDRQSEAYVAGNTIEGVNARHESGIIISNGSSVVLLDNKIKKTRSGHGLTLRNGAAAIGENIEISDCKIGILLFNEPPLALTLDDFARFKFKLARLSAQDIDYLGFYIIKNAKDALSLLRLSYERHGNYMILNREDNSQDLRNIFKAADEVNFRNITEEAMVYLTEEAKSNKNNKKNKLGEMIGDFLKHKNRLLLFKSSIQGEQDVAARSLYSFKCYDCQINGIVRNDAEDPDEIAFANEKLDNLRKKSFYIERIIKTMERLVGEASTQQKYL